MGQKETMMSIFLSFLSLLVSSLFSYYGLSVLFQPEVPVWILVFAAVTCVYGFLSITILIWSWINGTEQLTRASKISSISYLLVFFIGSLDVGVISGLEFVGLLFVAMCLWLNWYTIKSVVRHKSDNR